MMYECDYCVVCVCCGYCGVWIVVCVCVCERERERERCVVYVLCVVCGLLCLSLSSRSHPRSLLTFILL